MTYPVYNEYGIKIGELETSAIIPRNARLRFNKEESYFAITNTTEERLNELVEQNLEVLREEIIRQGTSETIIKGKEYNSQSIPRKDKCKVLWDEKMYCMGCEKIVLVKYVREGSETWDQVCCECGGDELTEMKGE